MGYGVRFRIEETAVQTPLGSWLGLGTQPHFEAPGDLWIVKVSIRND